MAEVIEIRPQPGPQEAFLSSFADIVIYGGSAGGGKSFGLLLDPLRYSRVPRFGAVIFRRTFSEVTQEGGLWDEATSLYGLIGAKPNQQDLTYTFPSGATYGFAHLQHEKDKYNYKGAQIPYLGFDELTSFTSSQFWYMLSRNRSTCGVRPCVRATTNPVPEDDPVGGWVARLIAWWIDQDPALEDGSPNPRFGLAIPERAGVVRYFYRDGDVFYWGASKEDVLEQVPQLREQGIAPEDLVKSLTFIPATIHDNQILLSKDPGYLANLHMQDPVEKARLLGGNWKVRAAAGAYFQRHNFQIIDPVDLPAGLKPSRHWDLAGTKPSSDNPDPDYTWGSLLAEKDGTVYWIDSVFLRDDPGRVEAAVMATASQDGRAVDIYIEQEPGQSGKAQIAHFGKLLPGYAVRGSNPSGDKVVRASPASAAASRGEIKMVRGHWNEAALGMLEAFPSPNVHDEPIDTLSQFWQERMNKKKGFSFGVG